MSIQAVSFGATTKKGNEYKKTHAGTITGLAVGVGLAGLNAGMIKKSPAVKKAIQESLVHTRANLIANGLTKLKATKLAKMSGKIGVFVALALNVLAGLAVGAGINKIINHAKAKKADKAAQ